jgi:hypothetical protein
MRVLRLPITQAKIHQMRADSMEAAVVAELSQV